MIQGRQLAQTAYYALIERIDRIQGELVEIDARRRLFGRRAVHPNSIFRNTRTLADSEEMLDRALKSNREQLEELFKTAERMEEAFKMNDDASMEAFVNDLVRRRKDDVA